MYEPDRILTNAEAVKTIAKIIGIARQDFPIFEEIIEKPERFPAQDPHRSTVYLNYLDEQEITTKIYPTQFNPDTAIR